MHRMTDTSAAQPDLARDAVTILILALAPAAGLGIARFAYALLLPDMRASLGWSYATAGFMNTVNAAGYLAGALIAAQTIRRWGAFATVVSGSVACVVALAASALTAQFVLLSMARLVAGIGAAVAFIAGGVIAAHISQRHRGRAAFLLSLYYTGPGVGIVISGIATPLLLEILGPGSWWIAWAVLAAFALALTLALGFARVDSPDLGVPAAADRFALSPIGPILAGYLLFGAGYIAYMTFMIAWVRDIGGSAGTQSVFWSLVGVGGMLSPWLWSRTIATLSGGRAVAALTAVTLASAIPPLFSPAAIILFASAALFGSAFFAVVTATTAFVRKNYSPESWPKGIAVMTIAFGVGQTVGPVLTGAITDFGGSLSLGLAVSAGLLAFAVIAALCQKDLARKA
jgi:predicted MFS family arabinose efflux permease